MDLTRDQLRHATVVWIARVSEAPTPLDCLDFLLDEHDRERAVRFHFADDCTRFVLGRNMVRHALGLCTGCEPETIPLAYVNKDRPVFPDDESLHFSITHTHDIVAVALAVDSRVGIDFEFMKTVVDLPELAERILSADDFRKYQTLSQHEAVTAFFRAWTRKEAYLKARGEGIGDGLRSVSVSMGPEEISPLTDARDMDGSPTWRLHNLTTTREYMGALACDDPAKPVCLEEVRLVKEERGTIKLVSAMRNAPEKP